MPRALRTRDSYYSIRVCHIKTRSPAKRFIADCVTYSQSYTFVQPLANPVDPVLTAFDRISSYYTVPASLLEAVCVWQSS